MARVFQCHSYRGTALHIDRLLDNAHLLPLTLVAILVGIVWIGFIDIEIFTVGGKYGEAPGTVLIVANGNTRNLWFATTENVPAGAYQMRPVAQRWHGLRAVRIIDHHRPAILGQISTDDPVVAANIVYGSFS